MGSIETIEQMDIVYLIPRIFSVGGRIEGFDTAVDIEMSCHIIQFSVGGRIEGFDAAVDIDTSDIELSIYRIQRFDASVDIDITDIEVSIHRIVERVFCPLPPLKHTSVTSDVELSMYRIEIFDAAVDIDILKVSDIEVSIRRAIERVFCRPLPPPTHNLPCLLG